MTGSYGAGPFIQGNPDPRDRNGQVMFDRSGNRIGNPADTNKATSNYQVAQQANMVSQNFGLPMQGQNPGMWANILPAAIQIKEHEKMNQVAQQYQETYIKNFQTKYGFNDVELDELKSEFAEITDHITGLIPDGDLQTMYKKYVQAYPNMYISMIPPEALQSKLAVKCHRDNKNLRSEVQKMSQCVTTLVQSLSKLQMAAGVPPIVSLMFESMPDPLTAITDPMYSSYNEAIKTYHALSQLDSTYDAIEALDEKMISLGAPASSTLLGDPLAALRGFSQHNADIAVVDGSGAVVQTITSKNIHDLEEVVKNMGTSGGCQTYGNEWNHTGPEPAMNPAMCLGADDVMQPGNPRNAHGRTAVYKAQRTQDGGAQWVMKGQVPNPMGDTSANGVFSHAQMVQGNQYAPANGDWSHYAQPAPRRTKKKSSTSTKKKTRKSKK